MMKTCVHQEYWTRFAMPVIIVHAKTASTLELFAMACLSMQRRWAIANHTVNCPIRFQIQREGVWADWGDCRDTYQSGFSHSVSCGLKLIANYYWDLSGRCSLSCGLLHSSGRSFFILPRPLNINYHVSRVEWRVVVDTCHCQASIYSFCTCVRPLQAAGK